MARTRIEFCNDGWGAGFGSEWVSGTVKKSLNAGRIVVSWDDGTESIVSTFSHDFRWHTA